MENTSAETAEEPVLLSWEMPVWSRALVFLIPLGFAAGGMMLGGLLACLLPSINYAFLMFVIAPLLIWYLSPLSPRRYAKALRFTSAGAAVTTVSGAEFDIPWDRIRSFRRLSLGLSALSSYEEERSPLYLSLPGGLRDKLIAILRETSNARIIGFDSETT